jgi:pimeloyl-ACP methyl ester carboxylesterase
MKAGETTGRRTSDRNRKGFCKKVYVEVNGSRQGMVIRSSGKDLPVLLFVHGGMPVLFLTETHPTGLEDLFTVVWWEQRGSGLSHAAVPNDGALSTELLVSDVIALTNHLRARYGQEKIYLMGHSGGTFIAIQAVQRAPELFHAYIGVAQIVNQLDSERLAYHYMLARFREQGETRWVRMLEATPVIDGTPPAYLRIRDAAMHRLGVGTTHRMRSIVTGLFIPSLLFSGYTLREKWYFWAAKVRNGVSVIWDTILSTDMREKVPDVQVPVYLLHGVHDYTCSYELARSYADTLRAPLKGFYTFRHSAHSPIFEEPDRVMKVLREDAIGRVTRLADPLESPEPVMVLHG